MITKTKKKRFNRICSRCSKLFTPTGKYCVVCTNCHKKNLFLALQTYNKQRNLNKDHIFTILEGGKNNE